MNITFEESNHLYKTVDDENFKWISATTFISKFHEEFDQEKMARQCSEKKSGKYKGMTPESIIEAWEEESARACEMGTRYHARRELETLNCKTIAINGIDVPVYHNVTMDDGKKVSTSQVLNEGVYPEFLLYLKTASICGQADRVEVVGNKLNIKDYKSNKHIDKESFNGRNGKKYMLVPLKHLEDCNFNHYQLQLSLYMYILLKHNPQLEPGTLEIHHVELKKNIKDSWWRAMVQKKDNIVGLDSSIIMNPNIWKASGHTENFTDPLSECTGCHKRFRADHLEDPSKCPECGSKMMESRNFNLMFRTFIGPVEDSASVAYLRPETAQGIFVNYKNIIDTQRVKVPFGIAQIGKAFRNEITPGNFIFRTREFEQMEMEYFVKPGTEEKFFDEWVNERMRWYVEDLGIKKENLRIRKHEKDELAHYAKDCVDIEYKFPIGWSEIEGIASRGDFDLTQHQKNSGQDLTYYEEATKERYIPYVIEPSCGVERTLLAVLCDAYEEVDGGRSTTTEAVKEKEFLLKINKKISPIKVAVLPLVKNKENIVNKATEVYELLKKNFNCQYDEVGAIGRRYRRHDEIGTPYAVTVDFETLEKGDVTLRDRDTMEQKRIKIEDLISTIKKDMYEN